MKNIMFLDNEVHPKNSPSELFRLRDSIYAADLVIASLCWLDFFTWLSKNPSSRKFICESLKIAERPCEVMLTLLLAMGLIIKENDVYKLAEISEEFLVKDSKFDIGPYFSSLRERPICKDMYNILKTDKPASWGSKEDGKEWQLAMEREDFMMEFTAAMNSRGNYLAPDLAKKLTCKGYKKLLDIAGGSGIYACSIVKENDDLEAVVVEKPLVDRVAKSYISKNGLNNKVSVLPLDMLKEQLPYGFDIHLYSHVFHDWNQKTVVNLIESSYLTLNPGGMIAIYDMHVDVDQTELLAVAEYSVLLMYSTEGKCYSIKEISEYLHNAGFQDINVKVSLANRSLITAVKPD